MNQPLDDRRKRRDTVGAMRRIPPAINRLVNVLIRRESEAKARHAELLAAIRSIQPYDIPTCYAPPRDALSALEQQMEAQLAEVLNLD